MRILITFLVALLAISVSGQTIPPPATISQTTNGVSQSTYISPYTAKYLPWFSGGGTVAKFYDGVLTHWTTIGGSNQVNFTGLDPGTVGLNTTNLVTTTSNSLVSLLGSVNATNAWGLSGNQIKGGEVFGTTTNLPLQIQINSTNFGWWYPNGTVVMGYGNALGGAWQSYLFTAIYGGQSNTIYVSRGLIGGGLFNTIGSGNYSVIVGGFDNSSSGAGGYNFIGNGTNNTASTGYGFGFIGNGGGNTVTVQNNVILNGNNNTNGSTIYGLIGNGDLNWAESYPYETILNGHNNFVHSSYTLIGSGQHNSIGLVAGANDPYVSSTILNGSYNTIGSNYVSTYDFIGVGQNNLIDGSLFSAIPCGYSNTIFKAANSIAIGNNINITNGHVAVISPFNPVNSTTNDQVIISATNGLQVYGNVNSDTGFTINGVPVSGGSGGFNPTNTVDFKSYAASNVLSIFFTPPGNILSTTNENNTVSGSPNNSAILFAGNSTITTGDINSLVVGGDNNTFGGASSNSVIVGGEANGNVANNSVVIGGYVNQISSGADNSIVGGVQSTTSNANTMVINMSDDTQTLHSTVPYQIVFGANNGVVIRNVTNGIALDVGTNGINAGAVNSKRYFLNDSPLDLSKFVTDQSAITYWVTNCVGIVTNANGSYIYEGPSPGAPLGWYLYTNTVSGIFLQNRNDGGGFIFITNNQGYINSEYVVGYYSLFSGPYPTNQPLVSSGLQSKTITNTNFLLGAQFTNNSLNIYRVFVNARCNPSTTGNAMFGLAIGTNSSAFTTTNVAGVEADSIFTTGPHSWSQLTGDVPVGGKWMVFDVTGEGLVTITNSYYEVLQ